MGLKKGLFSISALLLVAYVIGWIAFEMDHRTRAANLYRRGEYQRSIEMFTQVISSTSDKRDLAEALVARGNGRFQLGDSSGAIEDADQGLANWPGYPFAYILRATALLSRGDARAAMQDCNSAVESVPNSPWAYWYRGNVRRELGEHENAVADYDKAIALKPNLFLEAWDRLRPLRPAAAFYVDRSISRRLKGDLEGARSDCDAAMLSDNRLPAVFLNRGLIFLLRHNEADAQKDFDRFLSQRPGEKPYLDAEIGWAQAGTAPTAAKVLLARTAQQADAGSKAKAPEEPPPAAKSAEGSPAATEQAPPATQEPGILGFLKRPLPLVVTLVLGLALIFVFTGSFLILKDMKETLASDPRREFQVPLQLAIRFISSRRVLCLLAGLGLVAAYFFDKRLPMFGGIVFGVFFLSSMNKVGQARKLVMDARGQPQ